MQNSINFTLIQKLWMFRLDAFQFNRHLFPGRHVRAEVDVAERTGTDFTAEAIFLAYAEFHLDGGGGV
eukprot:CAMPEP_0201660534 /NCGR_PEP_ID=MMETSP0494-20130426/3171_1 /ASSEMBLY_ACC=CAM_ASM_000839 /TAXON_ID=420259 /ORGANISM="Thalassiosira gravida, Strain GMp14c1" /LENGTH=67 /DNA_ID=CAMNT_0048138449 /DNA_START=785 /DNA_END=988 /DNA_ORIENTATION=-